MAARGGRGVARRVARTQHSIHRGSPDLLLITEDLEELLTEAGENLTTEN